MNEEANTKNEIEIRSRFYGWRKIDEKTAIFWAKLALQKITTCKSDEERIIIINNRLKGINFKLDDLK